MTDYLFLSIHMKSFTRLLILFFGLLLTLPALAQNQDRQKIESAKIALITNRLNLTADQAQQFWPIYNEYSDKRKDISRQLRKSNKPGGSEAITELNESVELKQKLVDLEKDYNAKFLRVISPQQLQELHNTERMFNKMLIDRLNPQN
jgi:Spy/CpxP family protein refolding chaperone